MLQAARSPERQQFGEAEDFEIEGDGPLGVRFRECRGGSICIRSVASGTAGAETTGLLDGMILLAVEGRSAPGMGYAAAMAMMCACAAFLYTRPRRPLALSPLRLAA